MELNESLLSSRAFLIICFRSHNVSPSAFLSRRPLPTNVRGTYLMIMTRLMHEMLMQLATETVGSRNMTPPPSA